MSNTIFIANYIDNLDAISEYLPEFSLKIWNEVYLPDLKTDSIFVFHTGDWNKEFESNRKSMELPSFVNSFFYDLNSLKEKESKINFLAKIYKENSINFKQYDFFAETFLPTEFGDFITFGFEDRITHKQILGIRTKDIKDIPTIRIHSMCYTGDIFHSIKCDCREQLTEATKLIAKESGILIYPCEEGRGVGILNKLKIYNHQHNGMDTVEANYAEKFPMT